MSEQNEVIGIIAGGLYLFLEIFLMSRIREPKLMVDWAALEGAERQEIIEMAQEELHQRF